MAHRKHKLYRKVDSAEVQGEGSWVLLKAPTLDEIAGAELPSEGDQKQAMEFGATVLGKLVIDWDWVDDDDQPLPKPTPEIVRALPYAEIMFLMEATELDKLADPKN